MVVQKEPIELTSYCRASRISTLEGVSRSEDGDYPFQIEGARWHFLETLAGPRLGDDLLPFVHGEAQLHRTIDAAILTPLPGRYSGPPKTSMEPNLFSEALLSLPRLSLRWQGG